MPRPRTRRKKMGLCVECGGPKRADDNTQCSYCRDKRNTQIRERRARWIAAGLCPRHGTLAVAGQSCLDCWFMNQSWNAFKTAAHWREIKTLFVEQNGVCAYTGIALVPGVNASLDHIVPVSKDGPSTIENVQWVTQVVNSMKSGEMHDDFIAMCKLIAERHEDAPMVPGGLQRAA